MRNLNSRWMLLALLLLWNVAPAQQVETKIPEVHGTSFTDQPVNLPKDLQGKVGVLVLGFSRGSRETATAWGKRLAADYRDSPVVMYYQMPVLAGVPKLLRGYILGKIRGSVSEQVKPRFVPILDNEPAWRALTHYERGDDAYVVVVNGQGGVLWQTHDALSDAAYGSLKEHVEALRSAIGHPAP